MIRLGPFLALVLAPSVLAQAPEAATAAPAKILQTLAVFDRPESCAFSLDGKHLFVGNCGSDLFGPDGKKVGFVAGRGAISKLAVQEDGTVKMVARHFVEKLDGPLGLAVLPRATDRYPLGTLLVAQGLALLCDPEGASVTDASKLGTAVVFFDPESGARLGALDLGVGSSAAKVLGHAVLMPNSLAFDAIGNLFVTDSARGGDRLQPPVEPRPGLVRIPHRSIDDAGRGGLDFTPIPGIPNGVGYWRAADAVCVVTMGGDVPGGQALYQIPVTAFPLEATPEPKLSGIGTMDGIAFTPAGTIVVSRFSGDLLAIPSRGAPFPLKLDPETPLVAPADHRTLVLPDGTCLLAVPEQARTERPAGEQRVRILKLPRGL